MGKSFIKSSLRFECTQCGYCCRHEPGYVFLSKDDLSKIASLKGISENEFLQTYCRTVFFGWEERISLKEKSNNDCVFWETGAGCSIYSARPLQCMTYPFWPHIVASEDSWEEESRKCPGMNKGRLFSPEEIDAITALRESTSMISIKDK